MQQDQITSISPNSTNAVLCGRGGQKKRVMKNLTETDLKNLAALPADEWFDAIDVWPAVKRTDYSLGRLVQAGYVEKNIGDGPFYHPRYRKIKDASDSHDA